MKSYFKVDFIGIGAPRCATTWIYYCLKEHPEICMSEPKETCFFLRKDIGFISYKSYFKHCRQEKIKGEFTPMYMYHSEVIEKIKKHNPQVKLICSLRNPVERVWSDYLQSYPPALRKRYPFKQVVKEIDSFIKGSLYYSSLKKYFEQFPRENILVLIYEEIKSNPLQFCQEIYRFLGAKDNFVPSSLNKKYLESQKEKIKHAFFRNRAAIIRHFFQKRKSNFLVKPIYQFLVKSGIAVYTLRKINRLSSQKNELSIPEVREKEKMDAQIRNYLKDVFNEEVQKLEKLINKDLSFWQ